MAGGKSRFGTFFKRGLRALLPTVLTIGVILIVVNFFTDNLVTPVNNGIKDLLLDTGPGQKVLDSIFSVDVDAETYRIPIGDPKYRAGRKNIHWEEVRKDLDDTYPGIIGFLVALGLVFIAGFVLATLVGRRVLGRFESAMGRFPVVKVIYPYARQVVEFFMREKSVQFHSVIALEYPRKGLYSIGFVTGLGMKKINEVSGRELINVFIPSCPTPVTGWVIFVPVEDVIPMPITVDEAIRFAISGGVLVPDGQQNPEEIIERFGLIEPPSVTSGEPAEEPAESPEEPEEPDQEERTSS